MIHVYYAYCQCLYDMSTQDFTQAIVLSEPNLNGGEVVCDIQRKGPRSLQFMFMTNMLKTSGILPRQLIRKV